MKVPVYYVVRIYKNGSSRIDSGPHNSHDDAESAIVEDHHWTPERFSIFETYIEGELV